VELSEISLYWYVLISLIVLNIVSFLLYRSDKKKARGGKWRTPEKTLLLFSLLGPFGAFIAMRMYHHKTRKLKFVLVPIFMILQMGLLLWAILYLD
jgi:uncharacterized membrane protein YsdA (DUF1294 family)